MRGQLGDDQVWSTNLEIGVEMAMVEKLLCVQSKWRGEGGMEPVVCLREEWSRVSTHCATQGGSSACRPCGAELRGGRPRGGGALRRAAMLGQEGSDKRMVSKLD